jgi:hypothetical protein
VLGLVNKSGNTRDDGDIATNATAAKRSKETVNMVYIGTASYDLPAGKVR